VIWGGGETKGIYEKEQVWSGAKKTKKMGAIIFGASLGGGKKTIAAL